MGEVLWVMPTGLLVAWQGWSGTLAAMGRFFTKAVLLPFGCAYAVLHCVCQGTVVEPGWLLWPQVIDGLALGESKPEPFVLVVALVAFLGGWGQQVQGPDSLFLGATLAERVT